MLLFELLFFIVVNNLKKKDYLTTLTLKHINSTQSFQIEQEITLSRELRKFTISPPTALQ